LHPPGHYQDFRIVRAAIDEILRSQVEYAVDMEQQLLDGDGVNPRAFALNAKKARLMMPTEKQLKDLGMEDLLQAIKDTHGELVDENLGFRG